MSWEFWIDRGGTFTDCVARAPDGQLHVAKVLSDGEAPVAAIRTILARVEGLAPEAELPACQVKLGSTVATNALLERRGVASVLVCNHGLQDVFRIGTQERPDLFDLEIRRPEPVHAAALEVSGRVGVDGRVLEELDEAQVRRGLARVREQGFCSLAIVLIHAYAHPEFEQRIAEIAKELGFEDVVCSHEIAREMGLLARGETTLVDAYLTPLLSAHVEDLKRELPGSQLRFMQSSGGLTDGARFRGPTALLSGPAGGVVAAAHVARGAGHTRAIGFDMGGTSTDVSLLQTHALERSFESVVGGVRVKAPMLRIHTVAAGGGSLCRFDGARLTVGPESAGADPGPLCYGGARIAKEETAAEVLRDQEAELKGGLTLTDVNYFLGRVQPDRFAFPLRGERVAPVLEQVQRELREAGFERSLDDLAAGFVEVANASMAQAIQQVSVSRGIDPRAHALVGFGGAGGQHVCAIARALGIRKVLLHPLGGLLSAFGIGVAEVSWDRAHDAGRVPLLPQETGLPGSLLDALSRLREAGRDALVDEGVERDEVRCTAVLDLRYVGADTAISIVEPEPDASLRAWFEAFEASHQSRFGYTRPGQEVEIVTLRLQARGQPVGAPAGVEGVLAKPDREEPMKARRASIWFPGVGRIDAPVIGRESLLPGQEIVGPALILEATGTLAIDPGFRAQMDAQGLLVLHDQTESSAAPTRDLSQADPVRLEVFGNRFMSIAEQMGAVLRNTAVSTNIKDRLDYSCAVFDREGGLVANAPHIPVHLGAMGETVEAVRRRFPKFSPGDVVVTNDPFQGGSHLPDVTVVTPVFLGSASQEPTFYVASRGHHADIGGRTPGSMPPDSRSLEEEGVVIAPFLFVAGGRVDEDRLRALLAGARYPARRPQDNLSDIQAMVAANRTGAQLLDGFVAQEGRESVEVTMAQLQAAAAEKVAREISRLGDGEHRFSDCLDDGTPVCVSLGVEGARMRIDFSGTGAAVSGNLNAPRAVVRAAVIYVLRTLVEESIPLNGGCLAPVEIVIPPGSLLDPPAGSAVVGGNVETSQRLVDVLLGALARAAASQGTMNNVTFGDDQFGYYETIAGGAGAGPSYPGASGVHTHMTNTRITDAEVLESRFPVRLVEFSLRHGSGGGGLYAGGEGVTRRYEFTAPVTASLLTERRVVAPFGLAGGDPGACGRNWVERANGSVEPLPGHCEVRLHVGDRLGVETPGGGGFGEKVGEARPTEV